MQPKNNKNINFLDAGEDARAHQNTANVAIGKAACAICVKSRKFMRNEWEQNLIANVRKWSVSFIFYDDVLVRKFGEHILTPKNEKPRNVS